MLEGDLGGPDPFEQPGFSPDRPEEVWLTWRRTGRHARRPLVASGAKRHAGSLAPPRIFLGRTGDGKAAVRASYGIFHDRISSVSCATPSTRTTASIFRASRWPTRLSFRWCRMPPTCRHPPSPRHRCRLRMRKRHIRNSRTSDSGLNFPTPHLSADFAHMLGLNFQIIRNVNAPFPFDQTAGEGSVHSLRCSERTGCPNASRCRSNTTRAIAFTSTR